MRWRLQPLSAGGLGRLPWTRVLPAFLAGALACGDSGPTAGRPGRPSTRTIDDGGQADAGGSVYIRPATPRLPAVDTELTLPLFGEATYAFSIPAELGRLDVHFSVDTTASISGEIDQLQRTLGNDLVPRIRARVEDVAFGVSRYEDFPEPPFGNPGTRGGDRPDTPFALLSPIRSDLKPLSEAIGRLDSPLGSGGDVRESSAEALYQIATGEGYRHNGEQLIEPFRPSKNGPGTLGGVGFREGAMHVVVHITDAPTHDPMEYDGQFPDTHSPDQAIDALKQISARVIGIASGTCEAHCEDREGPDARMHLREVALATGAILQDTEGAEDIEDCPTGVGGAPVAPHEGRCPMVFEVNDEGDGLSDVAGDAIAALLDGIRFQAISAAAGEDPIGFVARIEASLEDSDTELAGEPPVLADELPKGGDGYPDTFHAVRNRTTLGFRVVLQNRVIAPLPYDQMFRVKIVVTGDELVVAERWLRVVVPAEGPPWDAGLPDTLPRDAGG